MPETDETTAPRQSTVVVALLALLSTGLLLWGLYRGETITFAAGGGGLTVALAVHAAA